MPNFAELFPEINTYLDLTFQKLNNQQRQSIHQLPSDAYDTYYENLSVKTEANLVEVLNFNLKKKKHITNITSDFQIKSSIYKGAKLPLVLPVAMYTKQMRYTTASWDKNTTVPYNDSNPIPERYLPNDGTQYPYLTIGDFLEDYILWDQNKFNKEDFFNGEDEKVEGCFLLPLRKQFFTYFTVQELMGNMPDGKKMFELVRNAGGVKAILRIPIQKDEYITYERLYYFDTSAEPDNNKGGIAKRDFCVALFPNIRFSDRNIPHYRVILSREYWNGERAEIKFYQGDEQVNPTGKSERNIVDTNYASNEAYIVDTSFDYMILTFNSHINGCIVPQWKKAIQGNKQFTFAVDFGTTNTYIEYSVDGATPVAFDIGEQDMQIHKTNRLILGDKILRHDYLPDIIGNNAFGFPIRTVLAESVSTDWNKSVFALADTNIPFIYEKEMISRYNTVTTNLKWSNEPNIQEKVKQYIEALFLMFRNKVLLNHGNLEMTKIVWFYPASMAEGRYNAFSNIWIELYKQHFGNNIENVIPMSESVAPYYFYQKKKNATTDVVSIDIGGGTTDVVIVNGGKEELLTSFRFAANSIWGDGYGFDSDSNGFVNRFKDEIDSKLRANSLDDLRNILQSLDGQKKSVDIISFFFSLANNKAVLDKNIKIDFNNMLAQDASGKYVFILFYTAIIYHIAHIMNAKSMNMPRHITFSGTGSKVLTILSPNDRTLERFTKLIFEKVYECPYHADGLTIVREQENPKEATCKGGLLHTSVQDYADIMDLKQTLMGDTKDTFVSQYLRYEDISQDIEESVKMRVENFIQLFSDLDKEFSYSEKFGADRSKWKLVQEYCKKDIKTYLKNGINNKKEEIAQTGGEPKVEETFFFYPLVGILNMVSQEVYKKEKL